MRDERYTNYSPISKIELLYRQALEARNSAYAPVTGIKFGAALLTKKGIHIGANIESWSLTLTRHAEMVAIDSMLFPYYNNETIDTIVVVGEPKSLNLTKPVFPCGLCRQYIAEFATDETIIVAGDLKGNKVSTTLKELMPNRPFGNMKKEN